MREIKFRAWDGNKMLLPMRHLSFHAYRGIIHEIIDIPNPNGCYDTKVGRLFDGEIMQYTGLKDKSGVEIYEGDIIKVAGNQIYEIQYIFELQYEEKTCGFGVKLPSLDYAWIIDEWAINNCDVIGNIYENPELLNK